MGVAVVVPNVGNVYSVLAIGVAMMMIGDRLLVVTVGGWLPMMDGYCGSGIGVRRSMVGGSQRPFTSCGGNCDNDDR